ncbi:amino acid permease aap11ld-like protein [Trypanosoma grayi]|uniref:amino acid permease aap11ld-like protein n=1 Tax=Trypanosoma grayi TaxID=71804 RepID=UPI0004F43521|nr:amino acid permease aap11ld-like protein [Trypanosoma grayi]KEG14269.1 amino acid permease aap11ld-like protein [Trypanosoma grayi]
MFSARASTDEAAAYDEGKHLGDSIFFYDARTTTSMEEMRRSLLERCFPGDGVGSGCLSLLTTAVTPAMLALPMAFSVGGLKFALACITFCIAMTIMSVRFLALASASAASDDYESVAGFFLGVKGKWFARFVLFLYNFGSGVVYLCFLKDVVMSIISVKGTFLPIWLQGSVGGILAFLLFVACVTPFTFNSRLASLRTMGFASNILTTFIIVSIIYRLFVPLGDPEEGTVVGGGSTEVAVKEGQQDPARWELILPYLFAAPIFVFSYEVQSNVMGVIKDLHDRTGKRIFVCICLALTFATAFYLPLGIFGSLSFPHMSQGNILALYDVKRDNLMFVCQAFCCYSAAVSFVFCMFPCRFAVYMLLSDGASSKVPKKYRIRIGVALAIAGTCCAIFLPDVAKAVSLLGSLFSSTLSMTMPAMFALKMRWSGTYLTSTLDGCLSWFFLFLGVFMSASGTLVALLDALGLARHV